MSRRDMAVGSYKMQARLDEYERQVAQQNAASSQEKAQLLEQIKTQEITSENAEEKIFNNPALLRDDKLFVVAHTLLLGFSYSDKTLESLANYKGLLFQIIDKLYKQGDELDKQRIHAVMSNSLQKDLQGPISVLGRIWHTKTDPAIIEKVKAFEMATGVPPKNELEKFELDSSDESTENPFSEKTDKGNSEAGLEMTGLRI